jgi:ribosomal-protein-alanine N-acetyltransferase
MVLQANYSLRRFKPSDLKGVVRINRKCLPENYSTFFFMNLHKRFPGTFIVAENNGKVVGYIMCRIETVFPILKLRGITKKGHVISIAVMPDHQKKGVGFALVQEAMQAMVQYTAKECYLEVRTSNVSAIELYKKLGFKLKQTISDYYADGEDAFLMTKQLPRS